VWGQQTLHGTLNTDGAPSWKPLAYLFTLPYALFGRTQLTLWTVTADAAALSAAVFAARIAHRLSQRSRGCRWPRRWPSLVAGLFGAVGTLGLGGLSHQMLIANSDPMVVALVLAAIDAHLCERVQLAFAALLLASLGRPEAWPFTAAYAGWAWRSAPPLRPLLVLGILAVPAAWFGVPAFTARSPFIAGQLAMKSPEAIHGDALSGVLRRFFSIYELPMQLGWATTAALAAVRRERTWLTLAAAATLWVAIEVGFGAHGWAATARYMLEAAAVLVVLTAAAAGWLLGTAAYGSARGRWVGILAVATLVAGLVPVAGARVALVHRQLRHAERVAVRLGRLQALIDDLGGAGAIRRCGEPVTFVGFQSTLAWDLGMNVGDVGYKPGREYRRGIPLVVLRPRGEGWRVRPAHTALPKRRLCGRLRVDYGIGRGTARLVAVPTHRAAVSARRRSPHRRGLAHRRHVRRRPGRLRHHGRRRSRYPARRSQAAHRAARARARRAHPHRRRPLVRHQRRRPRRPVPTARQRRLRLAGVAPAHRQPHHHRRALR
jgi:hypothetical protein